MKRYVDDRYADKALARTPFTQEELTYIESNPGLKRRVDTINSGLTGRGRRTIKNTRGRRTGRRIRTKRRRTRNNRRY